MEGIKETDRFQTIEPVEKGWSGERKYHVTDGQGRHRLLRISDRERSDRKEQEFRIMEQLYGLGVPLPEPVEFGTLPDGSGNYTLSQWCFGNDAEIAVPRTSPQEQFLLGCRAGEILRRIHSIPAPPDQPDWSTLFNAKIDRKISLYAACPIHFPGDDRILDYITENRSRLAGRPQSFQHGDYHLANMLLSGDRDLVVLDFDRFDYGDPWEEFNRIVWTAQASPAFARGQIQGYFQGEPPLEFFPLLALYIASNTLSSIPWALPFGPEQINIMTNQASDVLDWFHGMTEPIPKWYRSRISANSRD